MTLLLSVSFFHTLLTLELLISLLRTYGFIQLWYVVKFLNGLRHTFNNFYLTFSIVNCLCRSLLSEFFGQPSQQRITPLWVFHDDSFPKFIKLFYLLAAHLFRETHCILSFALLSTSVFREKSSQNFPACQTDNKPPLILTLNSDILLPNIPFFRSCNSSYSCFELYSFRFCNLQTGVLFIHRHSVPQLGLFGQS